MNKVLASKKEKSKRTVSNIRRDNFMKENIFKPAIIGGICISALLFCSPLEASFPGPDSSSESDSSESAESAHLTLQNCFFINKKHSVSLRGIEKSYPKLALLHVNGNNIMSLREIGKLADLLELHIVDEKLTSFEGVEGIPGVQILDLSKNLITSLEGIEGLTKLQELNLSDNRIESLKVTKPMPSVQKLDLSNNPLTSLVGIEQFSGLQELNLSNTNDTPGLFVRIVPVFAELKETILLPSVLKLDLSNNQLISLEGIEEFNELQELDLSNNQVSLDKLGVITQLANLKKVSITASKADQFRIITSFSPQLPNCIFMLDGEAYKDGKIIKEITLE